MLISIEAQNAKQTSEKNSPTPEIGLKCFLTQQSGAISSKTLKDSTPLVIVFIHVACASLLLGMRRHLQHGVARLGANGLSLYHDDGHPCRLVHK